MRRGSREGEMDGRGTKRAQRRVDTEDSVGIWAGQD